MGDRVREVGLAEATPETRKIYQQIFGDRDPVAEPGTTTGTRGDYWTTLALVPDIFKLSTEIVWGLLAPGRKLDPVLRELAILRNAIVGDCKFEYSQHHKVSRMIGMPEEKLAAIKNWTTSSAYSPAERAVMAATDELIGRNLVEDATFAELKRHLSDEQIVELFYVITTYRMHGMMLRALHLEFDNDTTLRMQEVPAPGEALIKLPQS
ncbi:MAG: carboxymuconolactone decarboxylase family protein [Candidatus Binatus sp.]|uniref:carboxymuconolactone decarboxylase family protein n=1 Tax=Candidatus Binatus sp. TaxID=2811406 RepID=UPI00271F161D|nr:carboxymuconolactone decarboxylase family protein [Candidatus Binatus sp.]MDO8434084.1 carboxymuconolactone decarboxylase family protein [Candidatus Binatus sp.]